MSHGHGHGHGHVEGPAPLAPLAARIVVGLLVVIGTVVLVGTAMLWPSEQSVDIPAPFQTSDGGAVVTEAGTVTEQSTGWCGSASMGRVFTGEPTPPPTEAFQCERSIIDIETGPNAGTRTLLEVIAGPGQPELHADDSIRLVRQTDPSGATLYSFYDFARGLPLTLIVAAFAIVVVAVARWRGLRALIGLGVAFGVLVIFMLPALLDGQPAVPVALVGGSLILYAVLYLAHGVNLRTSSALLGTLASMGLAALLSYVAIEMTHLTGLSEEQNTDVQLYLEQVSITGLLLAGFIIGSLGVLNDVTITQASSAFELAALDPPDLASGDLRVGDARGTRPHRQHRLHPRPRLRRWRPPTAAALLRRGPIGVGCDHRRRRRHRGGPRVCRWYRADAVRAAHHRNRRGTRAHRRPGRTRRPPLALTKTTFVRLSGFPWVVRQREAR